MHTKFIKYLIIFITPFLYAESIVIDAKLDEPDWDNAIVINDYYETVPYTLAPAKVKTITKILSNEEGIYVGFKNFQENSWIFQYFF